MSEYLGQMSVTRFKLGERTNFAEFDGFAPRGRSKRLDTVTQNSHPRASRRVTNGTDKNDMRPSQHRGDCAIDRAAPRVTLEELLRGMSPSEWRAAYKDAFDWGPDVGRERVEDEG